MPARHRNIRFNCRVIVSFSKTLYVNIDVLDDAKSGLVQQLQNQQARLDPSRSPIASCSDISSLITVCGQIYNKKIIMIVRFVALAFPYHL
jgi:hypothetical protein